MLKVDDTALLVIDVQGKLAEIMFEKELLYNNLRRLIQGTRVLGIPILWTEQNPVGLGSTVPDIAELFEGSKPILKNSFSCCREPLFRDALNLSGKRKVLLSGIETHVCVYQTARDLLEEGYEVHVVTDAVSSRTEANRKLGIQRMIDIGANRTGTEMALFELLGNADGDVFRRILRIVK